MSFIALSGEMKQHMWRDSAQTIFSVSYSLKMHRIYTGPVPTKMVQNHTCRDRPKMKLVHKPMDELFLCGITHASVPMMV